MPCRSNQAILALNAASNFLRDLVISVLYRLRQSRTLHTLRSGPISGVHFNPRVSGQARRKPTDDCPWRVGRFNSLTEVIQERQASAPAVRFMMLDRDIAKRLQKTIRASRNCASLTGSETRRRNQAGTAPVVAEVRKLSARLVQIVAPRLFYARSPLWHHSSRQPPVTRARTPRRLH